MTLGALRVFGYRAQRGRFFVLSSPVPTANAATVAHHYAHRCSPTGLCTACTGMSPGAHAGHRYVAHGYAGHRHYVWRETDTGYAYYGYNPGAGVAAGVIGEAVAGYPYCGDYSYYGSCDDYSYGYPYPDYDYGFGFGGPVFFGRDHFHHGFNHGFGFHGGGASVSPAEIAGHVGGFGGGHVGGFGGGGRFAGSRHMGGVGGGHGMGGGSAAATSAAAGTSLVHVSPSGLQRPFGRPRFPARLPLRIESSSRQARRFVRFGHASGNPPSAPAFSLAGRGP